MCEFHTQSSRVNTMMVASRYIQQTVQQSKQTDSPALTNANHPGNKGEKMASVVVAPQALSTAASNVADIGSSLNAATAGAAGQTSSLAAAAADEVSAAVAALFSSHGQEFQHLSAEAANFHEKFVQALTASADTYTAAEASAAKTLSGSAAEVSALPQPAAAAPAEPLYYGGYGYGYGYYGYGPLGILFGTFELIAACLYNPYYAPLYIADYFSYLVYSIFGGYYGGGYYY